MRSIFFSWLPLAFALTVLCALVHLAVQQEIRMTANDPQIQMAEDAATMLKQGKPVQIIVPAATVDIASSLAPFLAVYDETGKLVASSGLLNGQMPSVPGGVVAYTNAHGEDRLTWQPALRVRIAAVLVRAHGGQIVLAGRSLREIERREDQLMSEVLVAWLVALVGSLVLVVGVRKFSEKRR